MEQPGRAARVPVARARPGLPASVPAAQSPSPATWQEPPLEVGLTPGDAVTSALVIEALLSTSPRLRQDAERLLHQRRTGGHRTSARTGTPV